MANGLSTLPTSSLIFFNRRGCLVFLVENNKEEHYLPSNISIFISSNFLLLARDVDILSLPVNSFNSLTIFNS